MPVAALYNGDGLRITKTVDGVTYNYYYNGTQLAVQEWTQDNVTRTLHFIYDASGAPYAVVYNNGTTEYVYYYITDLQGNVVSIVSRYMNVVANYKYDAWGNVISTTNGSGSPVTGGTTIAFVNPILYRGYYYDRDTGLYYLQSRYYDPAVGRFLNADCYTTTGSFLGYNMFAYCENNPVMGVDYSGTTCQKPGDPFFKDRFDFGNGVYGCTDTGTGNYSVKYDVPSYTQGNTNHCGLYSQKMIEDYNNGINGTQEEANRYVISTAVSMYGIDDWNTPTAPTNTHGRILTMDYSLYAIYSLLSTYGPGYGYFLDRGRRYAHVVVVTGVDVHNRIIYYNDPAVGSPSSIFNGSWTLNGSYSGEATELVFQGFIV